MFDSSEQSKDGDQDKKHSTAKYATDDWEICDLSWCTSINSCWYQDETHDLSKNSTTFIFTILYVLVIFILTRAKHRLFYKKKQ